MNTEDIEVGKIYMVTDGPSIGEVIIARGIRRNDILCDLADGVPWACSSKRLMEIPDNPIYKNIALRQIYYQHRAFQEIDIDNPSNYDDRMKQKRVCREILTDLLLRDGLLDESHQKYILKFKLNPESD